MYIPLRAVADCFSANVSWNSTEKVAHISYGKKDVYVNCKQSQYRPTLEQQVPNYYVYSAGEYSANGKVFSVNIYTSDNDIYEGVIYVNDSFDNASQMRIMPVENVYIMDNGYLDGCKVGFNENSMIIEGNSYYAGVYPKITTYEAP